MGPFPKGFNLGHLFSRGEPPFNMINVTTALTERGQMLTPQSRILYIEDHEDTQDLVTLILNASNYQVTATGSIGEGLKLAREKHFDLYIIDSWLPDGTGIELCKRLRQLGDKTPIMFLSGLAYEADKQAASARRRTVLPG